MKKNERTIRVPGCRVIDAKVMPDGSCVLTLEKVTAKDTTRHHQEGIFKLVPASKLSLSDGFLNYTPQTSAEKAFKVDVQKVIKAGVQDFYRPTLDPSIDVDGRICYQAGMKPVVDKSYNWWAKKAKKFYPKRKSRLGTRSEYIAFLAVLIKEMVASGKSLEWAWNAVCNDSRELGHYRNSNDSKATFEATGNRAVCGWRDLANTCKILMEDKEAGGFWVASGAYSLCSNFTLALLVHQFDCCKDLDHNIGTGWLVLS